MTRFICFLFALVLAGAAAAGDRYVGYYYPEVSSEETFERVIRSSPDTGRPLRVDFVNVLTQSQLQAPESPRFVFFSKGDDADTLILVALDDEIFATIYRARAILAQLTVSVRTGGFFQREDLQYVATFFDLLQMMEFDELLITDGKTWTHRVDFIK
ncbi:hypothetical protein GV827_12755 [Sulfitobacter sp. JBTF-M27]|uniref:Molybdopterin-guanine dinucleotide biosynthesis protein A n=1 Tax=Sulfitobacter sediminilitoris TaxID=2698830 RepID=A0A6P0CAL2_9RHOB|nr:hypothetical protein [Sulfitobacter sediminilitoris]NEK23271.1 hypothetical protein [Sulfitobacter sediminilitoris]